MISRNGRDVKDTTFSGGYTKTEEEKRREQLKKSASAAAQSQSSTMQNAQARQAQEKKSQAATSGPGVAGPGSSGVYPSTGPGSSGPGYPSAGPGNHNTGSGNSGVYPSTGPGTYPGGSSGPGSYPGGSLGPGGYPGGYPGGSSGGYLTDYDPGPFTLSDYAEGYRDKLSSAENDRPDPFSSQYREQIDGILQTLQTRPDFNPDSIYSSNLYKNYRDMFTQQANLAMRDAQGQAAGLTGGYGSTYGLAAGQQAMDSYLNQLNSLGLDIYDRLYNEYLNEGQDLYNQLSALTNQDNIDYNRYRDNVSDWQWDLGYLADRFESSYDNDFDKWVQNAAQQQWAEEYAYQRAQDMLAQQNWERQFAAQQDQWEREFAYQQQQDAIANQLKAQQYANKSSGSKSSGSSASKSKSSKSTASIGYPYSTEYYDTVKKTVNALPTNAARFSYLYDISGSDSELEYLSNQFGVTPEAEPEEDEKKMTEAERRLNLYNALRGNIFAR